MSILIKGMEMPKYGWKHIMIASTGKAYRFEDFTAGNIATSYEVVEIPPHGRLIDADALLKLIDSCMFPSDMVTTRAVSMATKWIKEAPTVIHADKDGEA